MDKSEVIQALSALAQETRLDVFRLLVRAGSEGLAPGVIGEKIGVPAPTLSFHLKELKHAGVVTCHREGRSLTYRPNFRAMNELLGFLTENCCEGSGCRPRSRVRQAQPQPQHAV